MTKWRRGQRERHTTVEKKNEKYGDRMRTEMIRTLIKGHQRGALIGERDRESEGRRNERGKSTNRIAALRGGDTNKGLGDRGG